MVLVRFFTRIVRGVNTGLKKSRAIGEAFVFSLMFVDVNKCVSEEK